MTPDYMSVPYNKYPLDAWGVHGLDARCVCSQQFMHVSEEVRFDWSPDKHPWQLELVKMLSSELFIRHVGYALHAEILNGFIMFCARYKHSIHL